MEIKTLADILAQTPEDSKPPRKNKKSADYQSKRKQPRTQSSAVRSFAVSKKKNQSHEETFENYQTKRYQINDSRKNKPDGETDTDSSETNTQHLEFTDNEQCSYTKNAKGLKRKKKNFHPAAPYRTPHQFKTDATELVKDVDPNSIRNLLAQVKSESRTCDETNKVNQADCSDSDRFVNNSSLDQDRLNDNSIDNLPAALKAYLKTPEQRQVEKEEIKANSRLRWLAFYYLSRREHSKGELRQKLIDKEQDPDKIDELLAEFEDKGYQSDYRTALMLIREGIRKHRGRLRIKNDFYKRKVSMPANIDELIDMAMEDNEAFIDVMSDSNMVEGVDWLQLAVEARVKKYGDAIPIEPKIKARQLRFLQYRGFKPDICFEAISYNLETLENRL